MLMPAKFLTHELFFKYAYIFAFIVKLKINTREKCFLWVFLAYMCEIYSELNK